MFGGVEFTFSTGEEAPRALPVRQRPGRVARRSATALQAPAAGRRGSRPGASAS